MSFSSTFGAVPAVSPSQPATVQSGGRTLAAQYASASGKVAARLPTVDPVGLQDDVVRISREGSQPGIGRSTRTNSENAQSFVATFARRLFGDEASTAAVAYNLKSQAAPVQATGSGAAPSAGVQSTAFALGQAASFTGTGQIDTEDGRSFEFELKVKYEPREQLSDTSVLRKERQVLETPDVLMLTGKPLPEIKFPGTLDDLYKLLSRELRTEVSGAPGGASMVQSGELTLRLERLVDRAALLAPRARPDDPGISALERAKAVAQSYASAAAGSDQKQA